jgi:hypothetical protein
MDAEGTAHSKLNQDIAEGFRQAADLLQEQGANPFRTAAYRRAADEIAVLEESLEEIYDSGGKEALLEVPGVGRGIATAILEFLTTGRWSLLERLRGTADPESLFRTVPGIGPRLASLIHEALHVESLQALRDASHAGRLEAIPGIGPRKAAAIRASLDSMRIGVPRRSRGPADGPATSLLLDVDVEYRRKCAAGSLPVITPRRFNPDGSLKLPVLHTSRDEWHFTVLFSNTARAHRLGRTRDWVVIYFYDSHHHEGQHTVVTETVGPLAGKRVVRGMERQCREHYRNFGSI